MNSSEAREILLLYRPGTGDAADPQMAEALERARQDPELGRWFENHRTFQKAMRAGFQQIEVPAHLNHAQKAKLQEFAALCDNSVNPISQSFFEKAKNLFTS